MAKAEGVSFVEQHIEKLVLVICLVLLGWAALRWLRSSPAELTVIGSGGRGKTAGPPEEVDRVLRSAANRILDLYDKADVPVPQPAQWYENVLALRMIAPPRYALVDTVPPGPPLNVGGITGETKPIRLADMVVLIPAPAGPAVEGYAELPNRLPPAEALVSRGAMLYPLGRLRDAWQEKLKERPDVPVSVAARKMVIEVQEALPDGTWGPGKEIEPAAAMDKTKPVLPEPIPAYTGANLQQVRDARTKWMDAKVQEYILRPPYWPIYVGGAGWSDAAKVHMPKTPDLQVGDALVWFQDDKTLQYGRTFRYRTKLVFINPLLTYDDVVRKDSPQDTRTETVSSPFSEWSPPVRLDRQVFFFLTGANPMARQLIVTVYAQTWGQLVRKTFRIQPGEPMGGKASVKLPDPFGKGQTRPVEVDFGTGAVAVRTEFAKTLVREGGIRVRTSELIYVDKDGRLRNRIQAVDDQDELARKLAQDWKQGGALE